MVEGINGELSARAENVSAVIPMLNGRESAVVNRVCSLFTTHDSCMKKV